MEKNEVVSTNSPHEEGSVTEANQGRWASFKDSFRRADLSEYDTEGLSDLEKAALATANSPLSRSLKGRHLQMIAIGGSIGTGLFVGSGTTLATGGPAAILIAYSIIGSMLFCTMHSLGELCACFPVSGAFASYSTRFIDPAWGFAMGWNYTLNWFIVFPLELVAASLTVNYWNELNGTNYNAACWVAIFWVLIVCINFFGVKGYGEAEFYFSLIKVIAVVGFIILAIVLTCGGGPNHDYIGGRYWHNPGAFSAGAKGVCAVFVSAAFAFNGTELAGLAAAETANPRKSIPTATKQVFWRITLFYIVSLTLVGFLVPWDHPQLLNKTSSADASASPFVIAIKAAGIKGLPSVMNVVIMISVLSVGNSSIFGFSRTIAALAQQGQAPSFFAYIDRKGRPLFGIITVSLFGLFAFICAGPIETQNTVFYWLMAICGLSSIFTWGSINLCHFRFRMAMKVQGRSLREMPFLSHVGTVGSMYGFLLNVTVLGLQFWIALFPVGGAKPKADVFFQAYLAVPVVLAFYIFFKLFKRPSFVSLKDMDLDTGRRETDFELLMHEMDEEAAYIASKPIYYRWYKFWC
ncbi:General amino-acid permease GAP1 [Yarrowia sp. C11]|nr:General amino-acid permease GAP1 [Yarrowia sp. E02]KAG5372657.1 General amino-acid permease GAP1 [Yarrowia sp. C11]